jgi:hypothetical protein
MTCECGYADECDGETAIFYPLQEGSWVSTRPCKNIEYKEYTIIECLKSTNI